MAVMCETCKCSIYLEDQPDGTREYGGCESGCPCCNEDVAGKLAERTAQLLAITPEIRDEYSDENPILYAEQGPNRFALMSLFFSDNDGVQIQEDLELNDITIKYFTDDNDLVLTEGPIYDWALDFYKTNY